MSRMSARLSLVFLVLLFFLHLFLRAHVPTRLPLFVDEDRHMQRADLHATTGDEMEELVLQHQGKFLLYFVLAPFNTQREVALHMSRTGVALFSLIGMAALYALTRRLFNRTTALLALTFYAFAPLTIFFERLAIADGAVAVWATLTAWQSLILAERPTYWRAALVGLLVTLTVLAKLNMALVALLPVMAFYLFGQPATPTVPFNPLLWLWRRTRHAMPYLVIAGMVAFLIRLPFLLALLWARETGRTYELVDRYLYGDNLVSKGNFHIIRDLQRTGEYLLSSPMLVVLALLILAGAVIVPRRALYGLGWLGLVWITTISLVGWIQPRYFIPGMYPLALLFAAGIFGLQTRFPARTTYGISVAVLALWIGGFSLPFIDKVFNDPPAIEMLQRDERQYFYSEYSAYGLIEGLEYLSENGRPGNDGQVHVASITFLCQSMVELYPQRNLNQTCLHDRYTEIRDFRQVIAQPLDIQFRADDHMYILIEGHRGIPWFHPGLYWERVWEYQRPKNGLWVTIWEVRPTLIWGLPEAGQ